MLQLNNVIRDCTAKLEEEQPSNIAALQENKRVRCRFLSRFPCRCGVAHSVLAPPQETEEELDNATRQYTAGLEAHEREGVNSEVQAVVEAKHELEAKIKKNEKLLAQTAVRFLAPLTLCHGNGR